MNSVALNKKYEINERYQSHIIDVNIRMQIFVCNINE
jgi:hypothetical protein